MSRRKTRKIRKAARQHPATTDIETLRQRLGPAVADGMRRHRAGHIEEAEACYLRVLKKDPGHPDALHLLSDIELRRGNYPKAEDLVRQAIANNPLAPFYHNSLGIVLQHQGKPKEAMGCFEEALRLRPDYADALSNMGNSLKAMGKIEAGIEYYRRALGLKPDLAETRNNLCSALVQTGKLDEAIEHGQQALRIQPNYPEAWNNLGNAFRSLQRDEEAERHYRQALQLRPDYATAHNNLALLLSNRGQLQTAKEHYRNALEVQPEVAEVHNNLGNTLKDQGDLEGALACFRRAVQLKPDSASARSNLLFCLNYLPGLDARAIFAEHRSWAQHHAVPLAPEIAPSHNDRSPERRLRIGYLSPDFCRHSVSFFVEPLLTHHDRSRFEVLCYSNVPTPDDVTRRLQTLADGWREVWGVPDERVVEQIRADGIDILVDLAGHTAHNRLLVFARKPAPVQVTYIGYPNTTGLDTIDYRITDAWADPEGRTDHLHSESLMRLPRGFLCFQAPHESPEAATPPLAENGYITFGSFNVLSKVTPRVVALWSRILQSVPSSRLLLKSRVLEDRETRNRIHGLFSEHGISSERIELLGHVTSLSEHLECYHRVDIALDTFPYNGTTTSCEALWMGVPVLTLAGETHVSRVGVSLLSRIGLEDWIADSPDSYVDKAVRWAEAPEELLPLRAELRSRMGESTLTDGRVFTPTIEDAYRRMWRCWCEASSAVARPAARERPSIPVSVDTAPAATSMSGVGAGVPAATEAAAAEPVQVTSLVSVSRALRAGRLADAEAACRTVLEQTPEHPDGLHLAGIIATQKSDPKAGVDLIRRAIAANPRVPDYYNSLAIALKKQDRPEAAAEQLQHALRLKPDYAEAHNNLGLVYEHRKQLDLARTHYREALRIRPDYASAYNNLGNILLSEGELDSAGEHFERAIRLQPGFAEAHNNLGIVLKIQGKLQPAVVALEQAIRLRPEFAEAHRALGHTYQLQNRLDLAERHYREALRLEPGFVDAHSNLLLLLNYRPEHDPATVFEEHVRWARRYAAPIAKSAHPYENSLEPERRLRVGYVSPDFRQHSVSCFIEPILASHDRSRFEVFCYASTEHADEVTEQLQDLADQWRFIHALSDEQVEARIRDDKIDILVDLAGHTGGNRLLLFARKPAPIQVTYLGYPNTTGLNAMDYRLTDAEADPEGVTDRWHTEELVRLPNGFLCYRPPKEAVEVTAPPALKKGYVTFGSFSNLNKVTPQLIGVWASILDRLPKARLLLKARALFDEGVREHTRALFAQQGIDPARLDLRSRVASRHEHLALYREVDIALDPFPYNGATTTCEALWMGVPVVVLAGETHAARVGYSLLTRLGLDELAADSPDAYVQKALDLASDLQRLEQLRSELRGRMQHSPLANGDLFTRSLESAYRRMWWRWCGYSPGTAPAAEEETAAGAVPAVTAAAHPQTQGPAFSAELAEADRHYRAGRYAQAESIYLGILKQAPTHTDALHLLGLLYSRLGQYAHAAELIGKAIAINPGVADYHNQLGNVFQLQGNVAAAIQHYRKVLQLQPSHAGAHNNLANVLQTQGRLTAAIRHYQESLLWSPGYSGAHNNLANVLEERGQLDAAIAHYRHALRLRPDYPEAHSNLLLALNYRPGDDPAAVFEEHRHWAERYATGLADVTRRFDNNRDPDRPLHIGYVSPDFRHHSVGFFIEPILSHHRRDQYRVFCYANVACGDQVTARLQGLADSWCSIWGMSDEQVADRIRADRIDILVDLAGHTAHNRLLVFARKPAPVQISYLGYPNTTGLDTVDYRLTDQWTDPEGEADRLCTEKLVRMPQGFLCYGPSAQTPEVADLPAVQNGYVTFGSFNQLAKVTPESIALWSAILKASPGARLLLKAKSLGDEDTRKLVEAVFARHGITRDRLQLHGYLPSFADHMALYNQVDLALDTFPYHGTTTTCEALWMGLPVVVLAGRTHASRVGVGLLSRLNLGQLIAESSGAYVDKALELSADLDGLRRLRKELRGRAASSSLTAAEPFVHALERTYRQMWRAWLDASAHTGARGISPTDATPTVSEPSARGKEPRPVAAIGVRGHASAIKALETAIAHQQAGRVRQAEKVCRRILRDSPQFADAWHLLGVLQCRPGEVGQAMESVRKAIELQPGAADYHNTLGYCLQLADQPQAAIDSYRKALRLEPGLAQVHNNLGNLLFLQGDHEEATKHLQQAVSLAPSYAEAHNNLGYALERLERTGEAVEHLRQAIRLKPDFAEADNKLGNALYSEEQPEAAAEQLQHAIRLKPDYEDALNGLGNLMESQGRLEEAKGYFQRALRSNPSSATARAQLAHIIFGQGRYDEGIAHYRKLLRAEPDNSRLHSNLLLFLNYRSVLSPEEMLAEHKQWATQHAAFPSRGVEPHSNDPSPGRRLRIGYVSTDFRRHSVSFFLESLLSHHDRAQYEIFCYADVAHPDEVTQRMRASADSWCPIRPMSDEQVVERIREDRIDILVDLTGHTEGGRRLLVFGHKPAPIQVTYLGYPNTSGLDTMDYRLSDAYADPVGATDRLYTEELVRLPKGFLCYQPHKEAPEVRVSPLAETGHVTFGSFNNLIKVSPEVITLWSSILREMPDARLIIKAKGLADPEAKRRIRAQFSTQGIGRERIELLPRTQGIGNHLSVYHRVDIALDTFPYNGTTTTCEALWMGVPVIALAGQTHASRVGVSLLSHIGLDELVADSPEAYVRKAVELAGDRDRLQGLRRGLRQRMTHSPLTAAADFARSVEQAYRGMWERWCKQTRAVAAPPVPELAQLGAETRVKTTPREPRGLIRVLHHMARSGGTLISKCLGSMRNTLLLSEIHPAAMAMFNPLEQAHKWFDLLTPGDMERLRDKGNPGFLGAIALIHERCAERGKNLVIRDWSHLDFTGLPFLEHPSYRLTLADTLGERFEVVSTTTVRHPIDQWLSLRELAILRGRINLEEFLRGYLRFAEIAAKLGFVRFEDFTQDQETQLRLLCERLRLPYDAGYRGRWATYTTITGDRQGTRARDRITKLPRKEMEPGLLDACERNADYRRALELLGYGHPE
jgi:predicted O-linked N-acetylglucosamine transferase (SPINDLY family)